MTNGTETRTATCARCGRTNGTTDPDRTTFRPQTDGRGDHWLTCRTCGGHAETAR